MIGKLAPNSTYFTKGLVKQVPGRGYFRVVPSQDGDEIVASPPPSIVERLHLHLECERNVWSVVDVTLTCLYTHPRLALLSDNFVYTI